MVIAQCCTILARPHHNNGPTYVNVDNHGIRIEKTFSFKFICRATETAIFVSFSCVSSFFSLLTRQTSRSHVSWKERAINVDTLFLANLRFLPNPTRLNSLYSTWTVHTAWMKYYFEGLPNGVFILDDRFRSPSRSFKTVFFEQKVTLWNGTIVIERDL